MGQRPTRIRRERLRDGQEQPEFVDEFTKLL